MTTLTIYGVRTNYDSAINRTEPELDKFQIELSALESWRAPLGFNVTEIKVNQ